MGLDFQFSSEQEMFRDSLKRFLKENLEDRAEEIDKTGKFPKDILEKMHKSVGVPGTLLPEKYGGSESDYITLGIVVEEISKVDMGTAYVALSDACAEAILRYGTEEAKEDWLPGLAQGKYLTNGAFTESGCGSDATNIKCRAEKKGDVYVLNGDKSSISLTEAADVFVVSAVTDPSKGARGISMFLVPNDDRVKRSTFDDLGMRGVGRGQLFFDDVEIPKEYLLGKENEGFLTVMKLMDEARPITSLYGLGPAQAALEKTMAYAKEREAFGRPIGKFEGVQFPLAEYYTKIEAAKLLCYRALWKVDNGIPCTVDAAMAKYYAPEVAAEVAHGCLLLHGNMGYTEEYPIARHLRDSIALEIGDGTAQIQKIIIGRELLGRKYVPYR